MELDPQQKYMVFDAMERDAGMPERIPVDQANNALQMARHNMIKNLNHAQNSQMSPFNAEKGQFPYYYAKASITLGRAIEQISAIVATQVVESDIDNDLTDLLG